MKKIAVIGFQGFVGSALYKELLTHNQYKVFGVTRENYQALQVEDYDVVINSAMPSGRFWAKNHPQKDFVETVQKTADLVYGWKYKKFIQISTVSARCQLDTVYGRHKLSAEKLCEFGENLIVRLGALYSSNMQKGALADMLAGKTIYMSGESRYYFIALEVCCKWIATHFDRTGTVELGGKHAITLKAVADYLGKPVKFEGPVSHFDIEATEAGLPEAKAVLNFLKANYV